MPFSILILLLLLRRADEVQYHPDTIYQDQFKEQRNGINKVYDLSIVEYEPPARPYVVCPCWREEDSSSTSQYTEAHTYSFDLIQHVALTFWYNNRMFPYRNSAHAPIASTVKPIIKGIKQPVDCWVG